MFQEKQSNQSRDEARNSTIQVTSLLFLLLFLVLLLLFLCQHFFPSFHHHPATTSSRTFTTSTSFVHRHRHPTNSYTPSTFLFSHLFFDHHLLFSHFLFLFPLLPPLIILHHYHLLFLLLFYHFIFFRLLSYSFRLPTFFCPQGSPCRKSAEGAVQAARMMFERPAQPVYIQSSDKPPAEGEFERPTRSRMDLHTHARTLKHSGTNARTLKHSRIRALTHIL